MSRGSWSQVLAPMEGRADCNEQEGNIPGKRRENIWQHNKVCKDFFSLILIISFLPNSSVIPASPGRVLGPFSDLLKFTE